MITFTTKTDNRTGIVTKRYLLTQGDSFRFRATLANGDTDLVSAIKFKISKDDYCEIYSKAYEFDEESSAWVLFVESADTTKWSVTDDYDYITEIEVTYRDGGVDTIEKGVLKVTEHIVDCGGV